MFLILFNFLFFDSVLTTVGTHVDRKLAKKKTNTVGNKLAKAKQKTDAIYENLFTLLENSRYFLNVQRF